MLKCTLLNFVGNLCVEAQLRKYIATDMGGLLSQVYDLLASDVAKQTFDWVDSGSRCLQTLANCCVEQAAQLVLVQKDFVKVLEGILKGLPAKPTEQN